jgi:hypothetical protein
LTVYGHLFDEDLNTVAERLDVYATRNDSGTADAADAPSSTLHAV